MRKHLLLALAASAFVVGCTSEKQPEQPMTDNTASSAQTEGAQQPGMMPTQAPANQNGVGYMVPMQGQQTAAQAQPVVQDQQPAMNMQPMNGSMQPAVMQPAAPTAGTLPAATATAPAPATQAAPAVGTPSTTPTATPAATSNPAAQSFNNGGVQTHAYPQGATSAKNTVGTTTTAQSYAARTSTTQTRSAHPEASFAATSTSAGADQTAG